MHFVERNTSILKYFLYYIMYLAELLILLALMRTQANVQSLSQLRIDPLQIFPPLFLLSLSLEIPTYCFLWYYCSDCWIDDNRGLLPFGSSQMPVSAFIMLCIFLILSRHELINLNNTLSRR